MSRLAVETSLENRLIEWNAARPEAERLPIAWPNVIFSPPSQEIYLRVDHLPAPATSADLAGDHRQWEGIMQVGVSLPAGRGLAEVGELAAELDAAFPPSHPWTLEDGIWVMVRQPVSQMPAIQETNRVFVPLSIRYTSQQYFP